MCMESEALKEINELKAQVNALIECLTPIRLTQMQNIQGRIVWYKHKNLVLDQSTVQCLKQHDLALLNKLRDKFINSNHSCEHELLDMINSLELEK